MARQDSYVNNPAPADPDRLLGINSGSGDTENFPLESLASYIGAEFGVTLTQLTLPDNRVFNAGIQSIEAASTSGLPVVEPVAANRLYREGQFMKVSGQSTETLTLESVNAGSGDAPILDLFRNSSSPGNDDDLGSIQFSGNNATGTKTIYGQVFAEIINSTSGLGRIVISSNGVERTLVVSGDSVEINTAFNATGNVILGNEASDTITINGSQISLSNMPTADPGIANTLWNDGGVPVFSGSTAGESVVANPTVTGTDPALSSITVDGVAYRITPSAAVDYTALINRPRIILSGTTNEVSGGITINGLPTVEAITPGVIFDDAGFLRRSQSVQGLPSGIANTFVELVGDQMIAGLKNFTDTPTVNGSEVATAASSVTLTTNQTITGEKTFDSRLTMAVGQVIQLVPGIGSPSISATNVAIDDRFIALDPGGAEPPVMVSSSGIELPLGSDLIMSETGAIAFGTGATKALDDYEEGTFAASVTTGVGAVISSTLTSAYTKIGNLVTVVHSLIVVPTGTPATDVTFTAALPFSSSRNYSGTITLPTGEVYGGLSVSSGSTTLNAFLPSVTGVAFSIINISLSLTYTTNA